MNVPVTISITAEDIFSGAGCCFDTRFCPGALAFARVLPWSFVALTQTGLELRWPSTTDTICVGLPEAVVAWIKRFDSGAPDMEAITFTVMVPEEMV